MVQDFSPQSIYLHMSAMLLLDTLYKVSGNNQITSISRANPTLIPLIIIVALKGKI